ncbi:FAD binding oxidoreductase, putative [Talaromyces stipitatus ATCC 10500]|uniref:FAD binding oxidoreductase, putative n=1 Tax=Talaromyces stipitatus (strain ATCC 10500 / CBS 375.48 / QM 6759 / NRRL 1006) TaxID=441959 RepID=B8MHH2_TALSN|nr:FAD binding oxidoreductase, putative [Talaromyces stipitatus ATCC 10500]EED17151.1 FAD binding oxidoreductase, putative [Talaromyces stipitatus ATCC 10500]
MYADNTMLIKGAIVRVTSVEDVSTVVEFAAKRYVPFAVLSGGYSTNGASSTYGGIVIDLGRMNKVDVQPSSSTISVEGGAKWADVNTAAAQHGLAVVGPTVSQLGVGGTTLGGGIGWLTGKYGLVVDNLIEAQIVLADGSITTASETENPDLFWAIRGAGQDFGVITRFTFKAHPQKNDVYAGMVYLEPDKLPQLVDYVNDLDSKLEEDQGLFFGFTNSNGRTNIVLILFYNGPQDQAEKIFSPLLSLDSGRKEIGMMPYYKANELLNRTADSAGRKRLSGTSVTFPLDMGFFQTVYQHFSHVLDDYPGDGEALLFFEMLPYNKVVEVPNDATAYANRGPYYNVCSIFNWHDAKIDSKVRTLQQGLMNLIREEHIKKSGHGVNMYANYTGFEANAKDLFGDNLSRLKELKKQYDPRNVFRKWHDLLLQTGSSV